MSVDGQYAGEITTAVWSPRFERNVALGMVERDYWIPGTRVTIKRSDDLIRQGFVTDLPMQDEAIKSLLNKI